MGESMAKDEKNSLKKYDTVDGNTAAAHVAYALSEVAAIYPITPASAMGEFVDAWSAEGRKNIFGQTLKVVEMQSEAGAAGTVHGSLSAGALTTTFTSSQGLLLMLPNMFKIAGELQPTVFHVAARALAAQSLSIYGDHSDVMTARNTGFAMLASASVQEAHDMAVVAHLATLETRVPFLHFFDGFRTSHEIQKVELADYDTLKSLIDMKYVRSFRERALKPENPISKVGAQNPDVYFQGRETTNKLYQSVPLTVQKYMRLVGKKFGREYDVFSYVGHPEAERIIVAMGSACETIEETINYLIAKGEKVGLVKVRLYRPFFSGAFVNSIPLTVRKIAVLDRCKEPGSVGEPLYLDVVSVLKGTDIFIIGGRYGLSSKEFTPSMVKAVYDHLDNECFSNFTVGINDDVTNRSLKIKENIETEPQGTIRCRFWGLGSDGTVGANKNSIKIIGNYSDLNVQGYFFYDSKKSGGITISDLRFGKSPIQSAYLLEVCDFVALHNSAYIGRYDVLAGIRGGGVFLINCAWPVEEVFSHFTKDMQDLIVKNKVKVYCIDANKISQEVGLGNRISTVMQTAFFKLSGVLPESEAVELIKNYVKKTFEKKGEKVVNMNIECIDRSLLGLREVPVSKDGKFMSLPKMIPADASQYAKDLIEPIMRLKGDGIPVSKMIIDGVVPTGTSRLEKRGVALEVPKWIPENCIQCGFCSFVCTHAAIRTKQINPDALKDAPKTFKTIKSNLKNEQNLQYKVQIYPEDCTGCVSCTNVCPTKNKAIVMAPIEEARSAGENEHVSFFETLPDNTEGAVYGTVKESQLRTPLFEFSGACGGCGETPYIKLVTQLFGDRMIIANATGCSSIYGGTFPTIPYCKNKAGKGPAWANSLFEDNAEYGFGMRIAVDSHRAQLKTAVLAVLGTGYSGEFAELLKKGIELFDKVDESAKENADKISLRMPKVLKESSAVQRQYIEQIDELKDYFVDKSIWLIGGDGWAYDIDYGGLDHVMAMGKNVNILVLDTEMYSNTGGQASKSTPLGSSAKFAISGKLTPKKNLGLMAMSYGYVYVASVDMGASKEQLLKALIEAEKFDGPSIVIAYSPCINHGLDMRFSQRAEKKAADSGYWPLFRYNPLLENEGKNPFVWDSSDPTIPFKDYIFDENRYTTLKQQFPENAENLYAKAEESAKKRFNLLKKMGG